MENGENDKYFWHRNYRILSVLVFSLFFSWLLAIPFEGQVLYSLAQKYHFDPHPMIFGAIIAHFAGLLSSGLFIRSLPAAKRLIMFSIAFCIIASAFLFFQPSLLWSLALLTGSFLAGACVATWGFYFKNYTPSNERIRTAADGLIFSNLLMILINTTAIQWSLTSGLGLSVIFLAGALFFASRLPINEQPVRPSPSENEQRRISIFKPLSCLCLFMFVITINSGLMYQVMLPAFAQHERQISWYWAVPYIVAVYVMRNLPRKTNRAYILYIAAAMIGFSFIAFMLLDRSAGSYVLVNTLMLGACGVYDLFWWSILGEMLDLDKNAAKILGIGLSANVLGVLAGGMIGKFLSSKGSPSLNSSMLALGIVCVILIILPPLHKQLAALLKNHAYLTVLSEMAPVEEKQIINPCLLMGQLTERESEIAALLAKGKTYRMISAELHLSENTVKTHIKNIYAKLNIRSRTELVSLMLEQQYAGTKASGNK